MFKPSTKEEGELGEGKGEVLTFIIEAKDYHLRGGSFGPGIHHCLIINTSIHTYVIIISLLQWTIEIN